MGLEWLEDGPRWQELVLAEMDEPTRSLFGHLCHLDTGTSLLRCLKENSNTLFTLEDLASRVQRPFDTIANDLFRLAELGMVKRIELVGSAFFSLGDDPAKQQVVCKLLEWQDRWRGRLGVIRRLIEGEAAPTFDAPP